MFVICTVIITGSTTLRVLDVSVNDIGDKGMAMISEALQHNKSLTRLKVERCGLSVKGTVASVWISLLICKSTLECTKNFPTCHDWFVKVCVSFSITKCLQSREVCCKALVNICDWILEN